MGNSTGRRSDAHSGAARSTAASRPHWADHWRELSAERQAQSGINQGCEESVTGPGVGQFYFGVFGPGWVKIQSALTARPERVPRERSAPSLQTLENPPRTQAETSGTTWTGPAIRLLRLPEVCRVTGLGRAMIYRLQARNSFPRSVK